VRLSTSILLAALRVVLAKQAATLDVLSGGRLDLGVGVGWQREEYEAAGLDFSDRGRLLDHAMEVCTTLWTQQRASYSSPELTFDAIHQMPKPVQPGGVPIWVSGRVHQRTATRLARFGTGWIPWGPDAKDLGSIARMREAVTACGGDSSTMQVVWQLPVPLLADGTYDVPGAMRSVEAMTAAGVTSVQAIIRDLPAEPLPVLTELVRHFRSVTGRDPVAHT
jgi:alkanesulfonate monooxygenase SsuD/methylene tetrahydromethanopterin reductase-like flavin-dependent oxidoreductase (luciferase family)